MKILLYSLNFSPEWTGIGKYNGEMAEWLARRGHEIHVVTAPPYYPMWKLRAGYSAWQYRCEVNGAITIQRCPLWVPARPGGVSRLLHLGSFAVSSLLPLMLKVGWSPDIVFVVEPTFVCVAGARILARLAHARSWLHVQDLEIDAAFTLFGGRPIPKLIQKWETKWMCKFDRVSTISKRMAERILDKGVPSNRLVSLPNWVDLASIYPSRALGENFRQQLNIPLETTVALYSGNMGTKQGLEIMPAIVSALADEPSLYFLFCGDGPARVQLQAVLSHERRVRFLPLQPPQHLNALLNAADIHLLPQRSDAADLVLPSKIGGMLACGGAIVAGAASGTELYQIVTEAGGRAVTPDDPIAFANAMREFCRDRALRERAGQTARCYAKRHLGIDSIMSRFEQELQELHA